MLVNRAILLLVIIQFLVARGQSPAEDAASVRELIRNGLFRLGLGDNTTPRVKSPNQLSEVNQLRGNLQKAPQPGSFSANLVQMLKEPSISTSPFVGMKPAEAIADPNINVIDPHVFQVTKGIESKRKSFQPDLEEIKSIGMERDSESQNLHRENLQIKNIREETKFVLGYEVEEWKVLELVEKTALIGRTGNSIVVAIGVNDSYEQMKTLEFNVPVKFEVLKIWDSNQSHVRNLVLVAVNSLLIWHELKANDLVRIHEWNLLKEINSIAHFTHDGSEILLVSTVDDSGKVQAEFIEFNVPDSEFWVIQAFTLPSRPPSIACLDLGRDLIVAFVLSNEVLVYRHQYSKHLRGKFTHFKTIEAANVSTVAGFRIGGHSYLAIGGDQPQILRYFKEDFQEQTILSQSFGFVDEFLPIPIRTYRDDLILLVQHRLDLGTHSIAAVDALIWNGIAFENALSIPCNISADPNANGFICTLDLERDEGLKGAGFVHHDKSNRIFLLIPRHEAHSGMFRVSFEIVEAEDPLIKEMEQIKKSIELINQMLGFEESVKKEVATAMEVSVNPKNDFRLEGVELDEINTDFLQLDGNVELDGVEFLGSTWTKEDFDDLETKLDNLEKTIAGDELKLKWIDQELNKVNRINRQTQQQPKTLPDSQIHYISHSPFNGQLDLKSLKVEQRSKKLNKQDSSRHPRQTDPIEESQVSSLRVKNIEAKTINGIPVDDFLFLDNGRLLFVPNHDVFLSDSLFVNNVLLEGNGRVNGIDLDQEILAVDSPNLPKTLQLEHVVAQTVEAEILNKVPVDLNSLNKINAPLDNQQNITAKSVVMRNSLKVETVNGIAWQEFVDKLVPKHKASSIGEVKVEGDVVLVGDASRLDVTSLNNLPFPGGFVQKFSQAGTKITGLKTFEGELVTQAIDTDGTIDGIEPWNIITLDQPQNIPSMTTFKTLEVVKKLEVNGTIAGRQLNEFLPNPTLQEVNEVTATCSFRELIVEGSIVIEESLNGQNLETILSDVIYETNDSSEVEISSPKTFIDLKVEGNVAIASNFISDKSLDNILMTDRGQVATFQSLHGDIFFSNLKLSGLFDGINVTELESNSVRTFGDQFIETVLVGKRVTAAAANVKDSINGIATSDWLFTDQPMTVASAVFNELFTRELKIDGDVTGPAVFPSLNVDDLSKNFLSKSRKQKILVPVKIKSLATNGTFAAKTINGMDFEVFKKYMRGIKDFKSLVLSGDQRLDNLIVDGSVNLKSINDRNFAEIVDNAIWLNRPNTINGNMKFLDDVTVDGSLAVPGVVNKKPLKLFAENWVSNQETSIVLNSDKIFASKVLVEESLEVESINGIKFNDLLTLKDVVKVENLNIYGNVNVRKLSVDGEYNEQPVKALEDRYTFEESTDTIFLNADVHFSSPTAVAYLTTQHLNGINVTDWLQNLVRVNENGIRVIGEKIFDNQLSCQQGFYAEAFNDIKMDFLDNVVLARETAAMQKINGDLMFADMIQAQLVGLKRDLYTRFVSGCDPQEWVRSAAPIDRGVQLNGALRINASAFYAEKFTADSINGFPFHDLFTLHTNQTFNNLVSVSGLVNVKHPMAVTGAVNYLNLEQERENTLMRNVDNQVVTIKTIFNYAAVRGPLNAYGNVNSKNLQHIVLLNTSATIESAVNLRSLQATSLNTDDNISGTKFNLWYDNVLWNRGKEEQVVGGNWKVKKVRLLDDATGNGLVNSKSVKEIENNLRQNIGAIDTAISNQNDRYRELCRDLSGKANDSKNSIHVLKYLELDFKIQESSEIFSSFGYKSKNENFLLINTNCTSQLYKWQKELEKFKLLGQVSTGVVYDWAVVNSVKSEVFIVTNSRMEVNYPCQYGGLNVWKVSGDQIFHVTSVSNDTDVLQLHVNPYQPGRFFTLSNLDLVMNYDVFGEPKEKWQLSMDHYSYSFVPAEVGSDVRLFNGRKLVMLESKFRSRTTRFLWPVMNVTSSQNPGESTVHTMKMPLPVEKNRISLPSIPSKPLVRNDNKEDFVTRIRKVGDALRESMGDSFGKVNKLKIKNSGGSAGSNEDSEKTEKSQELEKEAKTVIKPPAISFVVIKPKTNITGGSFMQKLQEVGKAISNSSKLFGALDPKFLKPKTKDVQVTESSVAADVSVTDLESTKPPLVSEIQQKPSSPVKPQIILPSEDESFTDNFDFPLETTKFPEVQDESLLDLEQPVPHEVLTGSGVIETENSFFPERGTGEFLMMNVGTRYQKRALFAVTRTRDSTIKGNHIIEIYNDIFEGSIYQYIHCSDPSNLVALQFRDETLFAFLESRTEIQVYIYRGVQGFVHFRRIRLPGYAVQMTSLTLPPKLGYKCDRRYLVVRMETELVFYGVKISGNCGLNEVHCD